MTEITHKRLLLQGATGSIGKSTLAVVREHPTRFSVVGIAAYSNWEELLQLAVEFKAQSVALADESVADKFRTKAKQAGIPKIYTGKHAGTEQAADLAYDLLINAMMGGAGIEPTLAALERGIPVALANKETLVAAGPLVMNAARKSKAAVLPIDSEHSAILQCMQGETKSSIRRLWLTSSGGPFLRRDRSSLANVSVEEALNHPTWKMGAKITIDCATLFNKGLEVIEAQRLFDLPVEQIETVIHRQSIVHSMVEFADGSIKAQLSTPDMRLPILYALSYPERIASDAVQTTVNRLQDLTFEPVPLDNFPCLTQAYSALRKGGTAPAALSAADEIAVDAFLNREIAFPVIAEIIEAVVTDWPEHSLKTIEDVLEADREARSMAKEHVRNHASTKKGFSCC